MKMLHARSLALMGLLLGLYGCSTTTVKTTEITPLEYAATDVLEAELLDVGIMSFNPGIDELLEDKNAVTMPEIRNAEARFMSYHLSDTLQQNGSWGAVRVIPSQDTMVDLYVNGRILQSDGETLRLEISIHDSAGWAWFTREYEEQASKYSYDDRKQAKIEPFQGLYNRIANDMLEFRERLTSAQISKLRTVTELKFARSFAPDAFSDYLSQDKSGNYEIQRLPSESDPILQRVRSIRERDYMFVDTLQDYYSSFALEMEKPYREWRSESYREVIALRELRTQARNRMIAGAAAVIAGVAASGSGDGTTSAAGQVGILGGAYLFKSGLDKSAESQIHLEALQELGSSLEADIEPQVIELEDRSVTLTGTVDNQYDQWRGILHDIYVAETGDTGAPTQAQ